MQTPSSDEAIVDLLQQDPEKGIELIFRKYFPYVVNIVYRVSNDSGLAEDIAQDVFFELWKKKENLKITSSLKPYLRRAAINKTLNYFRDRKINFASDEQLPSLSTGDPKAQQKMEAEEMEEKITNLIDQLPQRCRVIFILSRYEELSYREIAEKLEISDKTVENQISKALKFLRENLAGFLEDDS
ncbi:MAG: RNA polymerase sigma-70 factor [Saprospiraceae bacterium]|nr:RNA polymerase sigma-70 factor [Saprospiraceae bacterium]